MSKEQTLFMLLQEHPNREIIFMYPSDDCSDYPYTRGSISRILIDEYVTINDRVWLRGWDEDELFNYTCDEIFDELFPNIKTILHREEEEAIELEACKRIDSLNWKEAIIIYIS